jgi:hypothetical protein
MMLSEWLEEIVLRRDRGTVDVIRGHTDGVFATLTMPNGRKGSAHVSWDGMIISAWLDDAKIGDPEFIWTAAS